jgi:hypothetical protein
MWLIAIVRMAGIAFRRSITALKGARSTGARASDTHAECLKSGTVSGSSGTHVTTLQPDSQANANSSVNSAHADPRIQHTCNGVIVTELSVPTYARNCPFSAHGDYTTVEQPGS